MSDLDEKLRNLVSDAFYDGFETGGEEYGDDGWTAYPYVDKIKQAFAEAGYHKRDLNGGCIVYDREHEAWVRLTGQEFLDRFSVQLLKLGNTKLTAAGVTEAAKKAVGL